MSGGVDGNAVIVRRDENIDVDGVMAFSLFTIQLG